ELCIEDRAGEEQIFIHAQRDWDQNIRHDQRIRVGNERHERIEANRYTENLAEEHHRTHADRRTEIKADDHMTVGGTCHIQLDQGLFIEAGREIHYHAGDKVVIDAGMELTASGGGSFLKLDPSGATLSGPVIRINAGGAAGRGSGLGILTPSVPTMAAMDRSGALLSMLTHEKYDEQCRFMTCHGKPVPDLTAALLIPGQSAPLKFRTDNDGFSSRITTEQAETLEVHLLWDELEIPDGADDYLKSRNRACGIRRTGYEYEPGLGARHSCGLQRAVVARPARGYSPSQQTAHLPPNEKPAPGTRCWFQCACRSDSSHIRPFLPRNGARRQAGVEGSFLLDGTGSFCQQAGEMWPRFHGLQQPVAPWSHCHACQQRRTWQRQLLVIPGYLRMALVLCSLF